MTRAGVLETLRAVISELETTTGAEHEVIHQSHLILDDLNPGPRKASLLPDRIRSVAAELELLRKDRAELNKQVQTVSADSLTLANLVPTLRRLVPGGAPEDLDPMRVLDRVKDILDGLRRRNQALESETADLRRRNGELEARHALDALAEDPLREVLSIPASQGNLEGLALKAKEEILEQRRMLRLSQEQTLKAGRAMHVLKKALLCAPANLNADTVDIESMAGWASRELAGLRDALKESEKAMVEARNEQLYLLNLRDQSLKAQDALRDVALPAAPMTLGALTEWAVKEIHGLRQQVEQARKMFTETQQQAEKLYAENQQLRNESVNAEDLSEAEVTLVKCIRDVALEVAKGHVEQTLHPDPTRKEH